MCLHQQSGQDLLFCRIQVTESVSFTDLPETGRSRWGEILDAEKTAKCVWLRPKLVAVVEFLEWTEGDRLCA